MTTETISRLLERLNSLLRSENRSLLSVHGLQPVQLEALHYLAQCNRYSDTAIAVSEYLRQTKGTVSQTLKVLEKKGLIQKQPDSKDKRVIHLQLTTAGAALVSEVFPSPWLQQALASLSQSEQYNTEQVLRQLLTRVQQQNQLQAFGQCRHCRYNTQLNGEYHCGLTGETLSPVDIELICREYSDLETTAGD